MGTVRGWTLACAVVVMVRGGTGSLSEICTFNGCRYTPSVKGARSVECDFKGMVDFKTTFNHGNLPSSIRKVRFSNMVGSLRIAEDAFSNLKSLKSIHYVDIRSLLIEENDMIQVTQPEAVSITIERINNLTLQDRAFSGWQDPGPNIVIRNVEMCNIKQAAFASSSVIRNVTLENVRALVIESGGLNATVRELLLKNVSMNVCSKSTFSGHIENMSLLSMTLNDIKSECLQAKDGWSRLSVQSSQLGHVMTSGIKGTIADVLLEDSNFTSIDASGFHLNVSSLAMKTCVVDEMAEDALAVRADKSIALQMSNVTQLRENAFRLLRVINSTGQPITINHLTVNYAENGSLTFSERSAVSLHEVLFRVPCGCNVQQRALQLAFGDDTTRQHLTEDEQEAVVQPFYQTRCMDKADSPTLAEFRCRSCSDQDGSAPRCSPAVRLWVWLVAATVAALLMAGTVLVLVTRQLRLKRLRCVDNSERHPCDDVAPEGGARSAADHQNRGRPGGPVSQVTDGDPESEYSEIGSPFGPGSYAEPEYSEVGPLGKSRLGIGSEMYVDMATVAHGTPDLQAGRPVYANCGVGRLRHAQPVAGCQIGLHSEPPLYANSEQRRH